MLIEPIKLLNDNWLIKDVILQQWKHFIQYLLMESFIQMYDIFWEWIPNIELD